MRVIELTTEGGIVVLGSGVLGGAIGGGLDTGEVLEP